MVKAVKIDNSELCMKLGPDPIGRGSIWANDVAPNDAVATHECQETGVGYVDDLKYAPPRYGKVSLKSYRVRLNNLS